MPVCVFRCEQCGRVYERVCSAKDMPENFRLGHPNPCEDGDCPGKAYRDLTLEYRGSSGGVSRWPIESDAWAVQFDQKAEAEAEAAAAGVPTEFKVRGVAARPVFRDRQHRRDYCRALRVIDADGGYGDYTGR